MKKIYESLYGLKYDLNNLTKREIKLYNEVKRFYKKNPHWNVFANYWNKKINNTFKHKTRKDREKIVESDIFEICQDLDSRLGIKQRYTRATSAKDLVEELTGGDPRRFRRLVKFKNSKS